MNGHWIKRDFNRLTEALQVSSISHTFSDPTSTLHQVNLTVKAGEFVTLYGVSGTGKTALLRFIAGLDTPDMGQISLDGQSVTAPSLTRALVFREPSFYPWLTVADNVGFALKLQFFAKSERDRQVDRYLELVGLNEWGQASPKNLSLEQLQRMALARALVCEPQLLLLDDPLAHLDSAAHQRMEQLLVEIWQTFGLTVLLVTRDATQAVVFGQRVYVLAGQIQAELSLDLPYPRLRQTPELLHYIDYITQLGDRP